MGSVLIFPPVAWLASLEASQKYPLGFDGSQSKLPFMPLRQISANDLTKITSCFLLGKECFLKQLGEGILDILCHLKVKYYLKVSCVMNTCTQSRPFGRWFTVKTAPGSLGCDPGTSFPQPPICVFLPHTGCCLLRVIDFPAIPPQAPIAGPGVSWAFSETRVSKLSRITQRC